MLNEPSDSETDEPVSGKLDSVFQSGMLTQQVQRMSINSAGMIPFGSNSFGGHGGQAFAAE